ncbi:MAG TPA: SHOCT domain-containing protein [Mycobacterium sp.]|jgi:hypothetical protein|uniref:SHOCT domain-containing protein n=1 Tax=Mycobacterium sp. TaxID=1785 RepID=UPI002F417B67
MNNLNKPVVLLAGAIAALFASSLVVRFAVLSQFGLSGGWTLYFGLPAAGIGVLILLLRLGLLNFGDGSSSTIRHWQHDGAVPVPSTPPASTSQRLQEIENLRASGAISEAEYTAERARIISSH